MFIETSAKAGSNVKPLFRKIAQALPGLESSMTDTAQTQSKFSGLANVAKRSAPTHPYLFF